MEVFGVPINIWHALVVEEHSGIIVFIMIALAVRVLTDIASRGKVASPRVLFIRSSSDTIAFLGSAAAVFFLLLSGITGYLIYPYSTLVSQDLLINKSLFALGSLFFWSAFFFLRYWFGSGVWKRAGLYLVYLLTAVLGFVFTSFTASMGAEITLGESGFQPLYSMFNFSWSTFTVQAVTIEITLALVVVGIVVALVAYLRGPKGKAAPSLEPRRFRNLFRLGRESVSGVSGARRRALQDRCENLGLLGGSEHFRTATFGGWCLANCPGRAPWRSGPGLLDRCN